MATTTKIIPPTLHPQHPLLTGSYLCDEFMLLHSPTSPSQQITHSSGG